MRVAVVGISRRQERFLQDALPKINLLFLDKRPGRHRQMPKVDYLFIARFSGHNWTSKAYRELPRERVRLCMTGCVTMLAREISTVLTGV